jgi:hypothetical protein
MKFSPLGCLIAASTVTFLAGCATTGHPCFSERVMYPDDSTACQYGRSYRCDDGDWIAYRRACAETAPAVSPAVALNGNCESGGITYASGSASCTAGRQYVCDNGRWSSLNLPCAVGDAPLSANVRGATCSYGGATVASSSAICQNGTTFLCNDGLWINLGTQCR